MDSVELPSAPKLPQHVAIIMDGNGRWASQRGLPRTAGHRQGVQAVRESVRAAGELGIPYLTLFSFSSENWNRPEAEIADLMGLLRRYLRSEIAELHKQGIRLRVIGERDRLEEDIAHLIFESERMTSQNTRMNLTIALSYGSRQEILRATKQIAERALSGDLALEDIDQEVFSASLDTKDLPDPDLLIRTSGEKRISNFLLWQLAYSELIFADCYWPDFGKEEFERAIAEYQARERRYGAVLTSS